MSGGTAPPAPAAPFRVLIAGAGIGGLACAYDLLEGARRLGTPLDLTVLEAEARPGGVISTERVEGCLIEGGPDCFVSDRPWALDLCRRLGLADEIIGTNPAHRRSFVYRRGRLLPIPEGYRLLAPSRLLPFVTTPILSLRGKLRAAFDLLLPRGPETPDESLASFVRRRFGRETLERLAQPLLAGIYNADPERLSLRATMPRFLEIERAHRSVILGLARERRRDPAAAATGVSGARYSLFVTLESGLQTLTDRLAASLPKGTLRFGAQLARLDRLPASGGPGPIRASTRKGDSFDADAVVLALPARAAAPIVRPLDPALADLLGGVPYGHAAAVNLAWRSADVPLPLDGFGFVVPRGEKRRLIACSFSSVKFAGRAPEGIVLLRVFLDERAAGEGRPEELEHLAREELRGILGITAAPLLARAHVHRSAMAQYEVGHIALTQAVDERVRRHAGLFVAGNGLKGIGLPDCVRSGALAAERVLALAGMVSLRR